MDFFKNLRLIVTIREMMRTHNCREQTRILWKSCRAGDVNAAEEALNKGADVNDFQYIGEYRPFFMYQNESYHAYITPLIQAAKSATKAQNKTPYYQIITLLLQNPKINLSRVIKNNIFEYKDFDTEFKSLSYILNSPGRSMGNPKHPRESIHLYPISDEVAEFMTDILKSHQTAQYLARTHRSKERD